MDEAWRTALRFNKWANLQLLDVCGRLRPAELGWSAPGTYGSVADTWLHIVGAERRYVWRLNGEVGRFSQHRRFPGIGVLKQQAAESGDALVAAAKNARRGQWVIGTRRRDRFKVDKAVLLVQAIHHGNEHRTHICTVLGSHGVALPQMDVWDYGLSIGALVDL